MVEHSLFSCSSNPSKSFPDIPRYNGTIFFDGTQANLGQRMDLRFERSTLLESPKVFGSPKQKAVPSGLNTAPAVCLLSFHGFHMVSQFKSFQTHVSVVFSGVSAVNSRDILQLDHAGSHIEAPGLMTITITTISLWLIMISILLSLDIRIFLALLCKLSCNHTGTQSLLISFGTQPAKGITWEWPLQYVTVCITPKRTPTNSGNHKRLQNTGIQCYIRSF